MHQYLQSQGFRRSVGTPLKGHLNYILKVSFRAVIGLGTIDASLYHYLLVLLTHFAIGLGYIFYGLGQSKIAPTYQDIADVLAFLLRPYYTMHCFTHFFLVF